MGLRNKREKRNTPRVILSGENKSLLCVKGGFVCFDKCDTRQPNQLISSSDGIGVIVFTGTPSFQYVPL